MNSKTINELEKYDRVLIIGPYPPPLGGVSVYIYRLHKLLINSIVINVSGKNKIKSLIKLLFEKYDVVYLNSYDIRLFLLLMIIKIFKGIDIIATSHNPRLFDTNNKIKKKLFRRFFKYVNLLTVVGEHIIDEYVKNNVSLPKRTIIEPAFLLPPLEEESKIIETYPKQIFKFIEDHSPIIIANAFRIVFTNNIDLYGLDMSVELTKKLINKYPKIGFIFAIADENYNVGYLNEIKTKIKDYGIENDFFFLTGQKELWPLFKFSNIMVRPTYSDGYGVSLAEALFFNCSAIASNVCARPQGTIVFQNRDVRDLYEKVIKELAKK